MEDYETIILIKQEVFVFHIPPRTTNRGYRAADWKLHSPDWTGRMRVVSKGQQCYIKLEDKTTGELFAKAPIEKYPGLALEAVTDSSRYFVLRIEDDNGRAAFIGLGFADRGDSFDLNVSLQEHFKWVEKTEEIAKGGGESAEGKSSLDLGFKEGQTITINIGKKSSKPRPKPSTGAFSGTPGLLPPPPGGVKLPAPSASKTQTSKSDTIPKDDLLLEFDVLKLSSDENPAQTASGTEETWGNFTTASGESSASEKKPNNTESWIGF